MSALEAGNLEGHQIGMTRGEFRSPDFVVGAARIRILPRIADVEWTADNS